MLCVVPPTFVVLALWAGYVAAVFILTTRGELGAVIRRLRRALLGPLALGLLATQTARPAAFVAGVLVGLIGVVHLAWAFGAPWPARDRERLVACVMPRRGESHLEGSLRSGFPSRAMTLAVTCAFLGMSACLLVPETVARVVPGVRWLVLTVAAVFALRGVVGLVYWSRRRESPGRTPSLFFVYNRIMYSPACLLIATLAAVSATSVR